MAKKIVVHVLIIALVVTGCSSSLNLNDYKKSSEFYEKANLICKQHQNFIIKMLDNSEIESTSVSLNPDSTIYLCQDGFKKGQLSTSNIKEIIYIKEGRVKRGIITGAITGLGLSLATLSLSKPKIDGGGGALIIYSLGAVALGGFIVGLIAALTNHSSKIIFNGD